MGTPAGTSSAPPPVPEHSDWPVEAVAYYFLLRARGMAQTKAGKVISQKYGVARLKTQQGYSRIEQKPESVAYLTWLKADLAGNLKQLPYAQKWERIAELGNLVLSLLERFGYEDEKAEEANVLTMTKISAEIRQLHEAIRKEVEGEGIDHAQVLSVVEEIQKRRQQLAAASERAEKMLAN